MTETAKIRCLPFQLGLDEEANWFVKVVLDYNLTFFLLKEVFFGG